MAVAWTDEGIRPENAARFLAGGGEMGRRMRIHDWSATPVGVPAFWPQPLRTCVALMLGSRQPMFTTWGQERILLYNDAYMPILGLRHPGALGRSISEVWFEIWHELESLFERADAGEATHKDDVARILLMQKIQMAAWPACSARAWKQPSGF